MDLVHIVVVSVLNYILRIKFARRVASSSAYSIVLTVNPVIIINKRGRVEDKYNKNYRITYISFKFELLKNTFLYN